LPQRFFFHYLLIGYSDFVLDAIATGIFAAHKILEVHQCLTQNQLESSLWSHQNSLDLIKMADDVRVQSGIKFPFEK